MLFRGLIPIVPVHNFAMPCHLRTVLICFSAASNTINRYQGIIDAIVPLAGDPIVGWVRTFKAKG
jgi:hypothetical protein